MLKDLSPKKTPVAKSRMSIYEKFKITSVTVSVAVLCWTLSHPFRDSSLRTPDATQSESKPIDPVSRMSHRSADADEYREEAIAMDMELMAKLRAKRDADQRRYRPGDREVSQAWEARTELIQAEIESLSDAEEGTLGSQRRESLSDILADGPI